MGLGQGAVARHRQILSPAESMQRPGRLRRGFLFVAYDRSGARDVSRNEIRTLEQQRHVAVARAGIGKAVAEVELSIVATPLAEAVKRDDRLVSDLARDRHDVDAR